MTQPTADFAPLRRRRQRGFSLIELMIAIAIALFMMTAFVAVFINMKSSFLAQDNLAQLQDNERLALTVLTNTVQGAGYFSIIDPLTDARDTALAAQPAAGIRPAMVAGQGLAGVDGTGAASDVLVARFAASTATDGDTGLVAGESLVNCLGAVNRVAGNNQNISILTVNASKELVCTVEGIATPSVIVGNVDLMKVSYLIDTTGGAAAPSLRYLSAAEVNGMTNGWRQVRAVRVRLRFVDTVSPKGDTTIEWTQTINVMNAGLSS